MKHRILTVLGITGVAMAATAATNIISTGPHQITPNWVIDLRTVIAVGGVVFPTSIGVVVAFGRFSEKIAVRLQQGEDRFKSIEIALAEIKATLREHREDISRLPCRGLPQCPDETNKRKR